MEVLDASVESSAKMFYCPSLTLIWKGGIEKSIADFFIAIYLLSHEKTSYIEQYKGSYS